MRLALAAGVVALFGLPLAAWLARPGTGSGGSAAPTATTAQPSGQSAQPPGQSAQPPAPPRGAVVLAGEAGPYAVALAAEPRRLEAIVLSSAGGGARGLSVRIGGHATSPCGSGCYATIGAHGRLVDVAVGAKHVSFRLPSHPVAAAALVRRERALYRGLAGVSYLERLASGQGAPTVTEWRLQSPSTFSYTIRNGPQAVVIGTRRWDRNSPRDRWIESAQLPALPQPATQWRHATNAWLVAPGVVAFADPSIPAYFRLAFDPQTLRPTLLRMTAAAHFMSDRYTSFTPSPRIRAPRRAAGG